MERYDPVGNVNHRSLINQFTRAQELVRRCSETNTQPDPQVLSFINQTQTWAQANFSPQDMALINTDVAFMAPRQDASGNAERLQQAEFQHQQQQQAAVSESRLKTDMMMRSLTKGLVRGGLNTEEVKDFRNNGQVVRKGKAAQTPEAIDQRIKAATGHLVKGGMGFKDYAETFDRLERAGSDQKKWDEALQDHQLTDSPELREALADWQANGLAEVQSYQDALRGEPDEVIKVDDDGAAFRKMDLQASWLDHDQGDAPFTKVGAWDEKWVDSGGEASSRAELVEAWRESGSDEAGFADELEAQIHEEEADV